MPKRGGDGAVLLAGDDDFEDVRSGSKVLHQRVRWVEGERMDSCKMFENLKDFFFGCTDGNVKSRAAILKLRAALEEVPSQTGAKRDGFLETWITSFRRRRDRNVRGEVRIEHKEYAKILLEREFAHHQRTEAGRGFPVHVACAVGRQI